MNVSLVSVSPDAEKHMAYCARVSNPNNQDNENYAGLLRYCIKHQHWSIFEQAFMTLEINTTRGLAAQILRHRSFTFQEFSQRYADTNLLDANIPIPDLEDKIQRIVKIVLMMFQKNKLNFYKKELDNILMKEWIYIMKLRESIAKDVLDLCYHLQTRIYMSGSVRFGFIILIYATPWTSRLVRIYFYTV